MIKKIILASLASLVLILFGCNALPDNLDSINSINSQEIKSEVKSISTDGNFTNQVNSSEIQVIDVADVPDVNQSSTNDIYSGSTIKIATFNIQVFGTTKAGKKDVVEILKKIVRKFDIVAVQEFRDSTGTVIPFFLNEINSMNNSNGSNSKYDVVFSERLGRTSSKEQYAFFFNTDKIKFKKNSSYVFNDTNDTFEREPFIAQFSSGNFDFALANIHTKPEDATREINKLADVADDFLVRFPNEKDIIVLGDYNADCTYFRENNLAQKFLDGKYYWAVDNSADTTTKSTNCTYDRIVFLKNDTLSDFAGNWSVVRFDVEYNLTQSFTEQVSDHYPVWGEFWVGNDVD